MGGIQEMPNYPGAGMLVFEAVRNGIPAAYCECGREGKLEENFATISCEAVKNLMYSLGMMSGTIRPSNHEILVGGRVLFSTRGGLFMTEVEAGDHLVKGQQLGYIMDLQGNTLENPGDMLYVIGSST